MRISFARTLFVSALVMLIQVSFVSPSYADELGRVTKVQTFEDVDPPVTVVDFITLGGHKVVFQAPPTSKEVLPRLTADCHPKGFLSVKGTGEEVSDVECILWTSERAPRKEGVAPEYWEKPDGEKGETKKKKK